MSTSNSNRDELLQKLRQQIFADLDALRHTGAYPTLSIREGMQGSYSLLPSLRTLFQEDINLTHEEIKRILRVSRPADYLIFPPDWLITFLKRFVKGRKVSTLLDPADQFGLLSVPLATATHVKRADALSLVPFPDNTLLELYKDSPVQWQDLISPNDALEWMQNHPTKYDLIVSAPPTGIRERHYENDQLAFKRNADYAHVLIANACLKLSGEGVGVFIVSNLFFNPGAEVRDRLAEHGLYVFAVLGLLTNTFSNTSAPFNLILIHRQPTDAYFVAELTENDGRNQGVLNLLKKRKAASDPSMGQIIRVEEFTDVRSAIRLFNLKKSAEALGLKPVSLSEVANTIRSIDKNVEFSEQPNTVYIPHRPGPVYSLPGALTANHYWQVEFDPARANALYVTRLLNTQLGKMMLSVVRSDTTIPNLSRSGIARMQLYLPSLEVQNDIVFTDIQLDTRIHDLSELKEELWSSPHVDNAISEKIHKAIGGDTAQRERFEDWIDALPFPIASILWAYHATNNSLKKYGLLQRYFEGLTQFMATVLLSGFYNADEWINKRGELFNYYSKDKAETKLKHASFGTWKGIAQALVSDLHQYLYTGKDALSPDEQAIRERCQQVFAADGDVLERLFPKALTEVLSTTNSLRNEWRGHGGLEDSVAPRRLLELEAHLNTTREILGRHWLDYRLIKPESSRKVAGVVNQDTKLLMGHHNPFVTITVQLTEQLDNTFLYLHSPDQHRALKLQPLIRLLEKLINDQNATYFYSRIKQSDVVFISHHYDKEPDITEPFAETLKLIEELQQLAPKDP